ncbi:hypothetical protein HELRODRAFT_157793 [Helobdella robusta]|uniref:Cyclic nucleotide-binding domain-containing protein n=1 Tax=Helobdella robusta TaxID=6412 RepID=T1EMF9_HELRO|nr:hypothetical protein HELRODRAFT_157793 [Helobdella robusta]ESN93850.1 hypothetical protein HELRODRAFT_157793 [Helobdella robusta]
MPSRRCLVAPQNTFVEHVSKLCYTQNSTFLVANARIFDNPIVYVSDCFCELTGFSKFELLQKSSSLTWMHGELTSAESIHRYKQILESGVSDQVEMLLYRKSAKPTWLSLRVVPIKSEKSSIILLLIIVKDVTILKQHVETDNANAGLSKLARFATLMTRLKTLQPQLSATTTAITIDNNITPIPTYKQEPPVTPPNIILHYSFFKTTWDWIILILTVYTCILTPYSATFYNSRNPKMLVLTIFDNLIDVIFALDILLTFHVTLVGPSGEVISDYNIIRKTYLKSWFIVDLIACLPYDFISVLSTNDDYIDIVNELSLARMLRISRVARYLDSYVEYGASVLVLLIALFVLVAHWFACIWYSIGYSESVKGMKNSWLQLLGESIHMNFTLVNVWAGGPDEMMSYMSAFYFTLSSMTTIGFGNISASTDAEKIFACTMMIFGSLLYATIFGNVATIIQQMNSTSGRYHEMLKNVNEFMALHGIPDELSERIIDFIVSTWSITRGIDAENVLSYCPADMRADICVHLNRKVFFEQSAFRLASEGCLRALAIHFKLSHWAPGNMLFHQGESLESLCFIASGTLEVVQDDEIVAVLSAGDSLGDIFWREETIGLCSANVRALTYCNLHIIDRNSLLEVLRFYQSFANSFARNLKLTYNLRKRVRNIAFIYLFHLIIK